MKPKAITYVQREGTNLPVHLSKNKGRRKARMQYIIYMDYMSKPLSNPNHGRKEKQPSKISKISLRTRKIFSYFKRSGCHQGVHLLFLIASMTRKVPRVHSFGHYLLPLPRSQRNELHSGRGQRKRLINSLLLNLISSNAFPFFFFPSWLPFLNYSFQNLDDLNS